MLLTFSMLSHSLRDEARKLAGPNTTVVYVHRASQGAWEPRRIRGSFEK